MDRFVFYRQSLDFCSQSKRKLLLLQKPVKQYSQHPTYIEKNLSRDFVKEVQSGEMRILKNNLCRIFRTHIGLSGGIQMTVLIHLPESIDEFLTDTDREKN